MQIRVRVQAKCDGGLELVNLGQAFPLTKRQSTGEEGLSLDLVVSGFRLPPPHLHILPGQG